MSDKKSHDLKSALDFVSREARDYVLDAVYCELFNEAGTLHGNTPESDVEWFAARLFEYQPHNRSLFDLLPDGEKQEWIERARHCIELLPLLTDRIANRYRAYTDALNTVIHAERRKKYGV